MKFLLKQIPIVWFFLFLIGGVLAINGYFILKTPSHFTQTVHKQVVLPKKTPNFDSNQVQSVEPEEWIHAKLNEQVLFDNFGIGSLYIPSLNIYTPILAGMENANLSVAAGTYEQNQQMGEGNYILLAHNLVEGGGAFHKINVLGLNERIYLTDFVNVYEYISTFNQVVSKYQSEYLESSAEPILTLIRCEGGLNTDYRLVVQAKLKQVIPVQLENEQIIRNLGIVLSTQQVTNSEKQEMKSTMPEAKNKRVTIRSKEKKNALLQWICIHSFRLYTLHTGYVMSIFIIGLFGSLVLSRKWVVK
ncbi:class A sortase [uncultured Enterococcus sp.]|uniref:class A sortase n=1 Tax=uncultured Enterococcus sp. TaxID=167972 RepID=UPI0022D02F2F|nr:class A sortase [uncultured Enterococcus sp.]CAI3403437.1 class A sortase [Enterococcus cecorum]